MLSVFEKYITFKLSSLLATSGSLKQSRIT